MEDAEVIRLLDTVWTSIAHLGASLTAGQWTLATDCPGWTVKDNVSHMAGTESMLLGRPLPDHRPATAGTWPNEVAEFNEVNVDYRRPWPGSRVLEEFREVTAARLAALRSMREEDFARLTPSPVGQIPYREFMAIRVLDCWVHDQDIRRAIARPGDLDGPVAHVSLERLLNAMPFVVGKKVAAPDGTTVVFTITGPSPAVLPIGVEGKRARALAVPPADPAVHITLDPETFACLACGRWTVQSTLDAGRVHMEGDDALGRRIVEQMNVMI